MIFNFYFYPFCLTDLFSFCLNLSRRSKPFRSDKVRTYVKPFMYTAKVYADILSYRPWHNETPSRKSASRKAALSTHRVLWKYSAAYYTLLFYEAAYFKTCSTRDPRKTFKKHRRYDEELVRFHCTINPDNEIERISHVISTTDLIKLIFYFA